MAKTIEIKEVDNSGRPISDSANGKTNAHSHYCDVVMHSKNYAVCLHLIDERKSGRLETLYADCSVAIGKKRCPALAMRKQEVEAGHAIYFKERIKTFGESFIEKAGSALNNLASTIVNIASTKSNKSSVTEKEFKPMEANYADALNAKIENSQKAEVKEVQPKEGESLIELAKRMMGKD